MTYSDELYDKTFVITNAAIGMLSTIPIDPAATIINCWKNALELINCENE